LIELKKADSLRKSVSAISSFISEGNLRFNGEGLHLKAIDHSQIVLVNFRMENDAFDKFEIEPAFVGVDLTELNKIMSRGQATDKLQISLTDSELRLQPAGELERKFNLPLIDVREEEINLPKHTYDATVEISARLLKEALKDASLFGSSVVFRTKGDRFLIEAKGSHGALNTDSKDAKAIKVKSTKDVTAKFSLNFLQNIIKESDGDEKITLHLKNDAPMKIYYELGKCKLEFFIAHMIL
jgi:proliferating cell nuclear antigen PCNA